MERRVRHCGGDMAYLNEDGTPNFEKDYIIKCDHCGAVEKFFDEKTKQGVGRYEEYYTLNQYVFWELFKRVRRSDLSEDWCIECTRKALPSLHKLRDVIELEIFVNRLQKAIYEKRKQGTQNHRATKDNAGQCSEGGSQRGLRYRAGHGTTQAREKYK